LLTGLAPGSRVAGYLLEKLVGVGGMAAVFRARDERLGRVVALKLLAGDEAVRRRFVREARAVATVDHPHIIPVYEAGWAGDLMYIAMRFVAGSDLQTLVEREGGLRPRRAAAFISPVASALDAAHEAGLVHRDVKPANILVDVGPGRPEHVYLTDFGVARGMMSADGLTKAGQFLGTPDYASPEQLSGNPADGRVDQYALACVTYTLLAGAVPYRRDEPMAVLYAHLYAPPPRLTKVRPDLPDEVDQVLRKGLAKVPEARYESCGAFADALRDALGVAPYDPSRPPRPPRPPRSTASRPFGPRAGPDQRVGGTPAPQGGLGDPGQQPTGPNIPRIAATLAMTVPPDGSTPWPSPHSAAEPTPVVLPPAPSPPGIRKAAVETWTAVVTADRAYYDSVKAVNDQDAASISFPVVVSERRFPLTGAEVRIGRRSVSRRIEPEIDLTGPPTDPGVSRLHAVLKAQPDGSWSVLDAGSPNGLQLNGNDIPADTAVPLHDGDRIHMGAWTMITIVRD
jgi:serine/threonine-protein kinase